MQPIYKTLELPKEEYYETHLGIINGVLPNKLTPTEIVVLAKFMSLEGDIVATDRFCTSARKEVKEALGISDGGLGNYMKALRDKKFIVEKDGIEVINPLLNVEDKAQQYVFTIIKK